MANEYRHEMTGVIDEAHGVKKGSRKLRAPRLLARAEDIGLGLTGHDGEGGYLSVTNYHKQNGWQVLRIAA